MNRAEVELASKVHQRSCMRYLSMQQELHIVWPPQDVCLVA